MKFTISGVTFAAAAAKSPFVFPVLVVDEDEDGLPVPEGLDRFPDTIQSRALQSRRSFVSNFAPPAGPIR
jgi:hypothetical protein